jgi:signal peptidase I
VTFIHNTYGALAPFVLEANMKQMIWEYIKTVAIAIALGMVLRTFVIDARYVPSTSMVPTIQPNDRLLVNKFLYRFTSPKRGDIIVFKPPEKINPQGDFVKRVVGLPGEKVKVEKGYVYINGEKLDEPYLNERPTYNMDEVTVPENHVLVLGDNRNYSLDGHVWGFLEESAIKGKAFLRFWPINRIGLMSFRAYLYEAMDLAA